MIEKKNEEWAVEVGGLTKSFGSLLVLRGIDLRVKKGEFLTIFGPNAAGKTTLIKILATLSRPSSGEVRLGGLQLRDDATEIRRRIGVVTHQTLLYDDLTVRENLRFYGRMYDVPNLEERIAIVIRQVGLEARLHDRVRTLSHGMQKRASIARAVIHNPSIVLLDEPEAGLDPHATAMLVEILDTLYSGERTVVMTTHNLERGLQMGDRVAILARGKIVYEEPRLFLDTASFQETYYRYTGARL